MVHGGRKRGGYCVGSWSTMRRYRSSVRPRRQQWTKATMPRSPNPGLTWRNHQLMPLRPYPQELQLVLCKEIHHQSPTPYPNPQNKRAATHRPTLPTTTKNIIDQPRFTAIHDLLNTHSILLTQLAFKRRSTLSDDGSLAGTYHHSSNGFVRC